MIFDFFPRKKFPCVKMTTNPEKPCSLAFLTLAVLCSCIVQVSAFSLTNCTASGALNNTRVLKVLCYKMGFWTVPSAIPSRVRYLDISFNSIFSIRAGDFEDLWNLRNLNLSNSKISWIQDGTAEHFPNLIDLNLAKNKLRRVSSGLLSGLVHLQVLRLDGNMIRSIDSYAFNALQDLRVLNLSGNYLRQIARVNPVLSALSLEELYLASNGFDEFNSWELSRKPLSLKTFVLSYNPLTKFQISDNIFPNLDYLDISDCGQNGTLLWNVTDKVFLDSVKTLNLSAVRVSEENIARVLRNISWASLFKLKLNEMSRVKVETLLQYACLPGLSVLRMQRSRISNLTARMLEPCSDLTELDFGENEISQISAPLFKKVAPLRVLRLEINRLAQINNLFKNLPMLEFINLSRNRISTLTCTDFANLTRLNTLYLYSNRISTLPFCVFNGLNSLELLKLGSNKLLRIGNALKDLPSLKVLELQFNKLSTIYRKTFRGLSALQTLHLGDNQISEIEAEAFDGLQNLTELILFSNRITEKTIQDPRIFSCTPGLISLDLHSNIISYVHETLRTPPFVHLTSLKILIIHSQRRGVGRIPSNLLRGLTSLKMFYGGNMNLNRLHPDTFNSTPNLWFLDLSKNAFADDESITAEVFHPIPKLTKLIISRVQIRSLNFLLKANLFNLAALKAPDNMLDVINQTLILSLPRLKYLDLQRNAFTCDCSNAFFIDWATKSNYTQVIYLNNYTCGYPLSLKGESILDLNTESCNVNIDFVMFVCSFVVVTVTLLASFVYQFLYWQALYAYYLFVAFLYDSKRKQTQQQHGFKYDAFISYNVQDEPWVTDELLPHLEGEQGWRLCLHHRDFEPGRPIIENIMDGIYSSRKTICLITYNYLMST